MAKPRRRKNRTDASARRARGQAGFSLMEIVAALAILGFSLAVLTPAIANNIRIGGEVRAQSLARLHLQSLLAELGVTKPLEAGEQSGAFDDGQRWRLVIEPYGTEAQRAQWGVAAWRVTATVSSRNGARERSVTTLRLGGKAPA
ncbi:MAG: type II secretion system protein [Parvularculaceae bacterium]